MADAPRDGNFIAGKLGVLNTDGITLVPIAINESNGGMKVNTTDTISFTMIPISHEDENYVNCLLFVGTDGLTYPAVCDSAGAVLIDL